MMSGFLKAHGNEKADPSTFAKWWGKERGKLNPMSGVKFVTNLTWNEILAPYNTAKALKEAVITPGSPLSWSNNLLKAVVLRDIHTDWISGSTI